MLSGVDDRGFLFLAQEVARMVLAGHCSAFCLLRIGIPFCGMIVEICHAKNFDKAMSSVNARSVSLEALQFADLEIFQCNHRP